MIAVVKSAQANQADCDWRSGCLRLTGISCQLMIEVEHAQVSKIVRRLVAAKKGLVAD